LAKPHPPLPATLTSPPRPLGLTIVGHSIFPRQTNLTPSPSSAPSIFDHFPLTPPWDPKPSRYKGFGARDPQRTIANIQPPAYFIIHLAWDFLHPSDRQTIATDLPVFHAYARLRQQASTADLSPLLAPRPTPTAKPIDTHRVLLMGCALLRFQCDYGDLIRWLRGPYTNAHRDWTAVRSAFEATQSHQPPPAFPHPDFDRTITTCTQGAPLKAHFASDYASCAFRNKKRPPKSVLQHSDDLVTTLSMEEQLSYHIILPRFLWRFLPGLLLSIFRMAYRYRDPKPRLCIDPSSTLSQEDTGNLNDQIPPPGLDCDINPPIYYGSAFTRYLTWLWNLRISFPNDDIIQTTDDISAAFRRVLYHPDVAPAFASVWDQWLIIPVSLIFGARNSPSIYMLLGEARSHLAHHLPPPPSAYATPLIDRLTLPPPPTADTPISPAIHDSLNPGISFLPDGSPELRMPVFVDDTGVAHARQFFRTAVTASVHAAYTIFGAPESDPARPPCINPSKWTDHPTHITKFLGFHINSRTMEVAWPLDKREKARDYITTLLTADANGDCTPQDMSRVLGLVNHAATVAPIGKLRTMRLQFLLTNLIQTAPPSQHQSRWYRNNKSSLPPDIRDELSQFLALISTDIQDGAWKRPIGLLIPRDTTITTATDASTNALGGWCDRKSLNHMWRISIQDLHAAGFPSNMGWDNTHNFNEADIDPKKIHINILEFIAIFIELWICVRQLLTFKESPSTKELHAAPASTIPAGGHRILVCADNTSALSWLRYASRTKRPPVRRLARLLTHFLSQVFPATSLQLQPRHIRGVSNVEADNLSRLEKSPSWANVMASCPRLRPLRVCLIPPELLSVLASTFSDPQTEESSETAMTSLWTVAPPRFVTGSSRPADTTTSVAHSASPRPKPLASSPPSSTTSAPPLTTPPGTSARPTPSSTTSPPPQNSLNPSPIKPSHSTTHPAPNPPSFHSSVTRSRNAANGKLRNPNERRTHSKSSKPYTRKSKPSDKPTISPSSAKKP